MRCLKLLLLLAFVMGAVGCGSDQQLANHVASVAADSEMVSVAVEQPNEVVATTLVAAPGGTAAAKSADLKRKIIYNTTIGLVVDDYQKFESALPNLVGQLGGFIASSNTRRNHNDSQSGDWTIRVPAAQYSALIQGVDALGFAESRRENAQDVTEEFVDVQARIKNKKALESRVLGILDDRSGKLADVLEIERELSRVREEIERMEGRLRYLSERTSLATVTIHCREQKEYQPVAAPTFIARVGDAWTTSITLLKRTIESFAVVAVSILPWMLLFSVLGVAIYRGGNRLHRRMTKPASLSS